MRLFAVTDDQGNHIGVVNHKDLEQFTKGLVVALAAFYDAHDISIAGDLNPNEHGSKPFYISVLWWQEEQPDNAPYAEVITLQRTQIIE